MKDILETRDRLLIYMEFVTGKQLYDEVLRRAHFSEKMAARIVYQLCSALEHCHKHGVIHCDLKPENVICTGNPTHDAVFDIKLTDFGLSKIVALDDHAKMGYCGTPLYVAPEMVSR